jgi:hypothetical protein
MTGLEVLNRELLLPEEWQLGGGRQARHVPKAPLYLNEPGFRDEGTYLGFSIAPVFAVTLLDQHGAALPMCADERNWNPARLELRYRLPQALVTERRTVLSLDAFVSHWTLTHAADVAKRFWIVLWTRRPDGPEGRRLWDIEANPQGISFQESATGPDGRERCRWGCALGASFDADSWSVNRAESAGVALTWETTPFFDAMAPGGLPGHSPGYEPGVGYSFFALAYPFEVPPEERLVVTLAAVFAPDAELARNNLERCVSMINPIQASEEDWITWLEEVPSFTCSDPRLQQHYWYRWAQRRVWAVDGVEDEGSAAPASVAQGVAAAIDFAWHHTADRAHREVQKLLRRPRQSLANVALAHAVRRVLGIHPDTELQRTAARRIGRWFETNRDAAALPVLPARSPWCKGTSEPVPSLSASVFLYDLLSLLDWLDGDAEDGCDFGSLREQLARRIHDAFWDSDDGFFCEQIGDCRVKTAFGFYPLLTDLVHRGQMTRIREHLCDPGQFWTQCPVPSISRDEPGFSPDGHWENQRLDRPFHGRVWPEINSHVIDALGRQIERASAVDRVVLAELIERTVRLAFVPGERNRPTLHEHYNPLTGQPAAFLGRTGPQGDWLIDHILRYIAGIRPNEAGELIVDPLPSKLEWFSVSRVYLADREIEVDWDHRAGLTLRIDETQAGHAPVGQALSVALAQLSAVE